MKTVAALVWSEWHARRWWLLILGVVGIAVALAMSVPLWAEASVDEIGAAVWLSLAAVVLLVTPFAVGFSMNYRDIAENRLGFYLTKPLKGFSLWVARYAAGLGLVLIAGVLPLLPTVAVLKNADLAAVEPEVLVLVITSLLSLTALLFYSAGFCLGIGVATGSQWRALDVVAACVLLAGLWWLANLVDSAGAHTNARLGPVLFCFLTLPALIAAGAVAISRGRVQANRIHRGLTLTLWPLVALPLLAFQPYAEWVFTPEMEDLVEPKIYWTETDSWWVAVIGEARWRPGPTWTYLYNAKTQRVVRLRYTRLALTPDASRVVWTVAGSQSPRLMSLRLDNATALPEPGPVVGRGKQPITLSSDGTRCALIEGSQVTVYDLPGFQIAFRGPLPQRGGDYSEKISHFASHDLLRIYTRGSEAWTISELDLATQSFSVTGTMPEGGYSSRLLLSPDGRRAILRNLDATYDDGPPVEVRDSRSGELLGTLSPETESPVPWFSFLADGRIVATMNKEDASWMGLSSASGKVELQVSFTGRELRLGGEIAPGRLLVATRSPEVRPDDYSEARLDLVDLESGTVEEVGSGLKPLMSSTYRSFPDRASPGSPPTKLFTDPAGNLVFFDPLIGKRETLLELAYMLRME